MIPESKRILVDHKCSLNRSRQLQVSITRIAWHRKSGFWVSGSGKAWAFPMSWPSAFTTNSSLISFSRGDAWQWRHNIPIHSDLQLKMTIIFAFLQILKIYKWLFAVWRFRRALLFADHWLKPMEKMQWYEWPQRANLTIADHHFSGTKPPVNSKGNLYWTNYFQL